MQLSFRDRVRSVEPQPDRVRVSFRQRAAYYWVANPEGPPLEALRQSLQGGHFVDVTVDGSTLEIVDAKVIAPHPR